MAVQHEGDAAGVERGIGKVAPPRARHRDVDVGRCAGAEARQVLAGLQRQAARSIGIDPNEGAAREEDEQNAEATVAARRNTERRAATLAAAPVADTGWQQHTCAGFAPA